MSSLGSEHIAFDISLDDLKAIFDWGESEGGKVGVTDDGRLLVYGLKNAQELVDAQPFERFYLSFVDDGVVGIKF